MANRVYDEEKSDDKIQPGSGIGHNTTGNRGFSYDRGGGSAGGSGGWARGFGSNDTGASGGDLKRAEEGGFYNPSGDQADKEVGGASSQTGSAASASDLRDSEESGDGDGQFASGFDEGDKKRRRFQITRRRAATFGVAALLGGGSILGFMGISTGPMQAIQIAQLMEKFHLKRTEDFGNDRTSKILLYALAGKGAENGRLGVVGNKAANVWEKKLLDRNGLRPVYNGNGRFVGFEIADDDKFRSTMGNLDDRSSERMFGDGTRVRNANDLPGVVRGGGNRTLSGNPKIIYVGDQNFGARRVLTKTVSSMTGYNKIATWGGSRLLIKRGGVTFHPLNKAKDKIDRTADGIRKYREERRKETAKEIKNGVESGGIANAPLDEEGNPTQDAESKAASDEAREKIEEAEAKFDEATPDGEGLKTMRANILTRAAGGAAIVGVMCAAHSFSDDIETYKFTNIVQPMMRMGWRAVAVGGQVMSGQDIDMDALGAEAESYYDPKTKTTWTDDRSIQAEMGNPNYMAYQDVPEEARGKNVNDKPEIFHELDKVPGLSAVCSINDFIGGLPVIKQIGQAATSVMNMAGLDDLMNKALAIASGQSINVYAQGAEWGGMANIGSFYAGNDVAISMGGGAMSNADTIALKQSQEQMEIQEKRTKSIAARYFNPYDATTVAGRIVGSASTPKLLESVKSPLSTLGSAFLSSLNSFVPGARAAETPQYDYGTPTYGFTLEEQQDPRFEDPYENAAIVEKNLETDPGYYDKYVKCFNVKVVVNGTEAQLQSEGESVNTFKIANEGDCTNKNDENLLRYRFYLADLVSAKSAACNMADDNAACAELGMESQAAASTETAPASASQVNIASYNVLGADHTDSEDGNAPEMAPSADRMIKSVEIMKSNNFNVVGLQELQNEQRAKLLEVAGDTYGIYPESADYSLRASENSIIWEKGAFDLVEGGKYNIYYQDGRDYQVPWIKLKDKSNNQEFYVMNTHDPVTNKNSPDGAKWREMDAKIHLAEYQKKKQDGLPVLFAGDFNSGFSVQPGKDYSERNRLTYCLLTVQDGLRNAYDVVGNKEGKCPTTSISQGRVIDHIYVSHDVKVTAWDRIVNSDTDYASDHDPTFASVNFGGDNAASGDAKKLAQDILDNGNISKDGRYVTTDLENTVAGRPAYGDVHLEVNLLQFLAELGQTTKYTITSITGEGCGHSDNTCKSAGGKSNHYFGKAVDFGCGFDEAKADQVAKKYGLMAGNERCDRGIDHSHFSADGF